MKRPRIFEALAGLTALGILAVSPLVAADKPAPRTPFGAADSAPIVPPGESGWGQGTLFLPCLEQEGLLVGVITECEGKCKYTLEAQLTGCIPGTGAPGGNTYWFGGFYGRLCKVAEAPVVGTGWPIEQPQTVVGTWVLDKHLRGTFSAEVFAVNAAGNEYCCGMIGGDFLVAEQPAPAGDPFDDARPEKTFDARDWYGDARPDAKIHGKDAWDDARRDAKPLGKEAWNDARPNAKFTGKDAWNDARPDAKPQGRDAFDDARPESAKPLGKDALDDARTDAKVRGKDALDDARPNAKPQGRDAFDDARPESTKPLGREAWDDARADGKVHGKDAWDDARPAVKIHGREAWDDARPNAKPLGREAWVDARNTGKFVGPTPKPGPPAPFDGFGDARAAALARFGTARDHALPPQLVGTFHVRYVLFE
jgi:hypothetical protein